MAGLIFPIHELLNEDHCYNLLRNAIHPDGLRCPNGHELPPTQRPHTRNRAPVVEFRCKQAGCGRVFNIFTGTVLAGVRIPCSKLVLEFRGFLQGQSTLHLAKELSVDRGNLLEFRHRVQGALALFSPLRADQRSRARCRGVDAAPGCRRADRGAHAHADAGRR